MPPGTTGPIKSERDALIIFEDGSEDDVIIEEPGALILEHGEDEILTIEAKKKY